MGRSLIQAMEDAKNGVVPCIEHEDGDDVEVSGVMLSVWVTR